jgi:creatinine amidohydrolase
VKDKQASLRLEEMTFPEVLQAMEADLPIILPVGSIEQHGPHLPLGVDAYTVQDVARRVGALYPAVVAPPLFYGGFSRPRTGGGRQFPGSTGLPDRTLELVTKNILEDWFRQGFRTAVALNGHYENYAPLLSGIELATEPHLETHKALLLNWWAPLTHEETVALFGDAVEDPDTEHASIVETSVMEAIAPQLVRSQFKTDGRAQRKVSYEIFPPPADIIWKHGIGSTAVGSSPEAGEKYLQLAAERIAGILVFEFGAPSSSRGHDG